MQPKEKLQAAGMGYLEVLGALSLILPLLTGIAPWLGVAAAIGLVVVQVSAIVVHIRRGEASKLGINVALILLAVAATWLGMALL